MARERRFVSRTAEMRFDGRRDRGRLDEVVLEEDAVDWLVEDDRDWNEERKDGLMGLVGDVGETGFDEVIAVPVV